MLMLIILKEIGDLGHIENVWRHTSEFRYSMQTLLYLMKPLEWVEKSWDSLDTEVLFPNTDYEQIIKDYVERITND